MKRYYKIFTAAFITCAFLFLYLRNFPVLVLEDISTNRAVFVHTTKSGKTFSMKWMHSVELQPWEEIFVIDSNMDIILDSTRFKSFGAGVPSHAGTETIAKDGYIYFLHINKKMPQLVYGISDYAKHTFYYEDREIRLYEIVKDAAPVKIYTSRINVFKYIMLKMPLK